MKGFGYDRVIVLTVCAALASLIVGFAVLSEVKRQLVEVSSDSYRQQQALVVDQVSDTLSNNIVNIENQLRVMASIQRVRDISNPEVCNTRLKELLQINQKQLGNLGRTDTAGYFACSVNPALIGQDTARYGSYVHDLINDPEHRPVLGRIKRPAGSESLSVGLHVPVYDNGQFYGTLGGAIQFNQFQDSYLSKVRFGENGYIVVVDDNGDLIYHPDKTMHGRNLMDPEILDNFDPKQRMSSLMESVKDGSEGQFNYKVDGVDKIAIYKSFPIPGIGRNWGVVATIPSAELDKAIVQSGINRIFLILVGMFSMSTALLTFVSLRNIMKNKDLHRVKNDFISITSHQLRTPATIVKQNLGIVRGGFTKNRKERDKFIDAAYHSNENQLSIIENILSVSKLEAGRLVLHKEDVELQKLIRSLTRTMKMSLAEKDHKLHLELPDEPVRLQADRTKLRMVIENLLSNAIKYTPSGGEISITLQVRRRCAEITVRDNGKGIAPKDIPKLFQRFHRLHADETSHVQGTGLGLYLTKKIVQMHHGSISVESHGRKGTSFLIRLPLR